MRSPWRMPLEGSVRFGSLAPLAVVAALIALATPRIADAQNVTTRWTNPAGGAWTDPANWDNGVPDNDGEFRYRAEILEPGPYEITIDTGIVVDDLTMGATASLTLTAGSGLIVSNGDATMCDLQNAEALTLGGEFVVSGGELRLRASTLITGTIRARDCRIRIDGGGAGALTPTILATGRCTLDAGELPMGWAIEVSGTPRDGHADLRLLSTLFTNRGTLTLTSEEGAQRADLGLADGTSAGRLQNMLGSTIAVEPGAGGSRAIHHAIENRDGVLSVSQSLLLPERDRNHMFEVGGSQTIATGRTVLIRGEPDAPAVSPSLRLDLGGTTTIDGTLVLDGGYLETTGGGGGGTGPSGRIRTRDTRLRFEPGGVKGSAVLFELHGRTPLDASNVPMDWSLDVVGTPAAGHATLVSEGSFLTNRGSLTLTSAGGSYASSIVPLGTGVNQITNELEGTLHAGTGSGGSRTIAVNLLQHGTLTVDHSLLLSDRGGFHTFQSDGTQMIAAGQALLVRGLHAAGGGSFPSLRLDIGGTTTIDGTLVLDGGYLETAGGGGGGTGPSGRIRTRATRLRFEGGGAEGTSAVFELRGRTPLDAGEIPMGWSLALIGTPATGHATIVYAGGSLTNRGALALTATGGAYRASIEPLTSPGFAEIRNEVEGVLTSAAGSGGARAIALDVLNHGTFAVEQSLLLPDRGRRHTFEFDAVQSIASGRTLLVRGARGTGGPKSPSLFINVASTTTIDGTLGIDGGRLELTGGGGPAGSLTGRIRGRDTELSFMALEKGTSSPELEVHGRTRFQGGELPMGWSLHVVGTPDAGHASVVADNSVANRGLMTLTAAGGAYAASIEADVPSFFELTNEIGGTLRAETGSGGSRAFVGNLRNLGTLTVDHSLLLADRSRFHQLGFSGTTTIAPALALIVRGPPDPAGSATLTIDGGSVLTADGPLILHRGHLATRADADVTGKVVLREGELALTSGAPSGSPAVFCVRGRSTIETGSVPLGWTLRIEADPSDGDALVTRGSDLGNEGTVELVPAPDDHDATFALPGQVFDNLATGTLGGTGTLIAQAVIGEGTFSPGLSAGLLTIEGDLTLGAAARFVEEFEGSDPGATFDQLRVNGTASVGGVIDLRVLGGYMPGDGDLFEVLTAATLTGTFPVEEGFDAGDGLTFMSIYKPTRLLLVAQVDGPSLADVTTPPIGDPAASHGVFWLDADGDGDLDVHVTRDGAPNALYRNDGGDAFVLATLGDLGDAGPGRGACFADIDNDGDLDAYVVNDGAANVLLRNDDGTFADATTPPLDDTASAWSAAWADYDQDGFVDLFLGNRGAEPNRLFHNEDDAIFIEVTPPDLADAAASPSSVSWADADGDGDEDLYVVNDGDANRLFRNDGAGAFADVAAGDAADAGDGRSGSWADYDNDLDLDLFVTNATQPSLLLRNEGGMSFTDVTLAAMSGGTGAGGQASWADYDNDGDVDIHVTRGDGALNSLFRNVQSTWFVDVLRDSTSAKTTSTGASWGDYDGDGDVDLYVATLDGDRLLRNDQPPARWLHVELVGVISNRSGIGARVLLSAGGNTQVREIEGGSGFVSQASLHAEFGLGEVASADSVTVLWPSGIVQVVETVGGDQVLTIIETAPVPTDPDTGEDGPAPVPTAYRAYPGAPNPFNPATRIRYDLPEPSEVRLRIFDGAGRLVRTLLDGHNQAAARHAVVWDGRDEQGRPLGSGVYFYELSAGTFRERRSLVLVK